MRSFLLIPFILLFGATSFAKVETLTVVKVLKDDDKAIVERPNGEQWLIEKGPGCPSLWKYEGKSIIGNYIIDPESASAKLLFPDAKQECRIWSGKEIKH